MSACQDVCAAISRDMYYVEEIVDQRASKRRAGGWEFRVRWLGWAPEHDTWEPEGDRRPDAAPTRSRSDLRACVPTPFGRGAPLGLPLGQLFHQGRRRAPCSSSTAPAV